MAINSSHILLIEDDLGDSTLIREYLADSTDWQFEIYQATRLQDGIISLNNLIVDLVLLDLSLPDSQGLGTFHSLHHQIPDVPVVILTGNRDQTLAVKAVQAGAQDYLLKGDLNPDVLTRSIRYAIERQRLWKELQQQKAALEAQTQALAISQQRWHTLVNRHSDAIIVTNYWGCIEFVNPAAESLFGCSARDLLGSFFGPLSLDQPTELSIRTAQGEVRIVELCLTQIKWDGHDAYFASLRDITSRKQAEQTLREQQALLKTVMSSAPILLFAVNAQGIFTLAEGQGLSGLSLPPHAWVGRSINTLGADLDFLQKDIATALKAGAFNQSRVLGNTALECWYTPLRTPDGTVDGGVGVAIDVTSIVELREERDRLFDLSLDLFFIADRQGHFLRVNPAFQWKVGYNQEELYGKSFLDWVHPDDRAQAQENMSYLIQGQAGVFFQGRFRCLDDIYRWITWSVVFTQEREMFYAVGHDVTDQKHFEERLRFEATHDRLTGLPNRGYFLETLENQITFNHRRHNDLFAVFFIDLDHFKLINDTLGHQAGDHLLIAIAQRLQACMREGDMVARLGGDEFAVLLNSVSSLKDVTSVAQRMLDTIAEPITLKTESTYTTASIGIVLSASHYNDSDLMLRDADAAMYQAKEAGKARYVIF